jgi:D-beta-D-heptose 7-phosphate kinase/D-beta-D-heptose 1-phosphate adenosyltransferase
VSDSGGTTDTLVEIATALAAVIDANPDYEATAVGETVEILNNMDSQFTLEVEISPDLEPAVEEDPEGLITIFRPTVEGNIATGPVDTLTDIAAALAVAINSDDSARRPKGETRPVIRQDERAAMLAALECVDYVTVFDEDTAEDLIRLLRPDYQVKGGTTPVVVEREIVQSYGGKVVTLEKVEGLSTTAIINRIVQSNQNR